MKLEIVPVKNLFKFVITTKIGNCKYVIEGHEEKSLDKAHEEGLKEYKHYKNK